MKQNLFNKLWLRVGMIVAIMTTALAGTAWAETVTFDATTDVTNASHTSYTTTVETYNCADGSTWKATGFQEEQYASIGIGKGGANYLETPNVNGTITSVAVTWSGNASYYLALQTTDGTELDAQSNPSSSTTHTFNVSGTYSQLRLVGRRSGNNTSNALAKISKVVVTYSTGGGGDTPTTYTVTYNANGGTGEMTDDNSPYEEDDEVTLLTNTFTAPEGMMWSAWDVKDADDNAISVTNNTFSMPASNVTVTAQWVVDPNAPQYEWVETSLANLTSSDIFVIVGNNGTNYALSSANGTSSAPPAYAVTINNGKIDTDATPVTDALKFNISGDATNGYTFYPNGSTTTYIYCLDNNNGVRIGKPNANTTEEHAFTVLNGYLKAGFSTARYIGIYNSTDWRCYTSTTGNSNIAGQTFKYYKRQIVSTDPVIVASDPAELAYDAAKGEFNYSITNPTGASLSATSNADWITNVAVDGTNSKVTFNTTANSNTIQRTGTITLSYTGADNKVITVTQAGAPVIYTTIPALFAAATGTETSVYVTFNNWVVSGVSTNGKNVFVTDNAGNGFVIYSSSDQSGTYAVGNILSGTAVSCSLKKYDGFAEIVNLDANDLTITTGGNVTVANIALANLAGVNTGALVSYEGLTCSVDDSGSTPKYYLSDGTTTLQVYTSLYAFGDALVADKTYNITGVYQQYNSTKEILPRSAADIVEVQVQHNEYDLTVSNLENVEMFVFDAADDSNSLLDGEGTIQVYDGTAVMISVSAESGYVLESLTVDGNDVTSQIDESGAYTFTMPTHDVTITATAIVDTTPAKTLTNANIVAAGDATTGYNDWTITDENGKLWNAHAIKNKHSNATSSYHFLQIRNYQSGTAYYLQVPEYGTKITSITMTVSGSSQPMTGGSNAATLFFSASNSTSTAGDGVASGTGASTVTIDCSSLNLNTGYITASGAVRIWDVTVVYEETESVTVTSAGYATYCSENALDFTDTDIKAYVGTKSGDKLTFTLINQVPANTGMLLVYAGGKTEDVPVIASATAVEGNCLVGVNAEKTINSTDYILNVVNGGAGFYKAGSWTTLGAHKAYIPAAVGNGVKGFVIDFDDDATGISLMEDGRSQMEDGAIYNVAGQRLQKMQKGINIVNGKKIAVK